MLESNRQTENSKILLINQIFIIPEQSEMMLKTREMKEAVDNSISFRNNSSENKSQKKTMSSTMSKRQLVNLLI